MFAVIVLGIGFIMLAAIFPVMISQSRTTVEETSAAAVARGALAFTSKFAEGGDTMQQGPLLPATDLYFPPATAAAQTNVSLPAPANAYQFQLPPGAQFVSPGRVLSFNDQRLDDAPGATYRSNLWNGIKGSLITPSDTRYAWVPLYRRDNIYYNPPLGANATVPNSMQSTIVMKAPFATVYFIPVAVRDRTNFDGAAAGVDLAGPVFSNLEPRPVQLQILPNGAALSRYVMVFDNPSAPPFPAGMDTIETVTEGAFVIVSDDRIVAPIQTKMEGSPNPVATQVNVNRGRMNGRIYRVGTRRPDLDAQYGNLPTYEIAPGFEFKVDPGADGLVGTADDIGGIGVYQPPTGSGLAATSDRPADAYVVGRAIKADGTYEGPPQDVGAFVTFVRVN